jgi:hypothetical protein
MNSNQGWITNLLMPSRVAFIALALSVVVAAQRQAPVLINHVTVIDVSNGAHERDMAVVVVGNRIASVEQASQHHPASGVRTVDGRGRYLIPGLWDMHQHSGSDEQSRRFRFPLDIATGVTGVRDTAGDCWSNCADFVPIDKGAFVWREEIAKGALVGPRIVASSPLMDGPRPFWPGGVAIHSVDEARAAVDNAVARRDDFVKVYSFLHRDAYFAVAEEAKRKKIVFAGHVPYFLHVTEVSDAGQRSIEHMMDNFSIACSSQEEQFFKERLAAVAEYESGADSEEKHTQYVRLALNLPIPRWLASYDKAKCQSVARHVAANHTWVTPTLVMSRGLTYGKSTYKEDDPRLQYMKQSDYQAWSSPDDPILGGRSPQDWKNWHDLFVQQMEAVGILHDAGVLLLAGTDVDMPYTIAGFSVHDEMALFVQAGLSPLEALQTATVNPAKYFDDETNYGSVEKGKLADLVLLDGDPTRDINNTTKIRAVVANGRLFTRADLDELFKDVKRAAR